MSKALSNNKEYKFIYLLLYIPCFLIGSSLDNDIWFILNSGRYICQHGFPYTEPFTIHEGMSFVMQQWLSALTFWGAYSILGELGTILIVTLIYMLFVYMTFKLCMFLSEDNFLIAYVISYIIISLICLYMTERPYIFLFLIILIEIYFLEKYIKLNKNVYLLPLLLLSILLINLQAAMWPLLFVILLPYLIDSFKFKFIFIEGQGYDKKNLLLIILGMIVVGFINPYRTKAITYLFNSYGFEEINKNVVEMGVADINTLFGKIIFATIFLVFFAIFIYKKGRYKLRYYLLTFGTAYMAISSVRSYSIFIICGIIPLSYYFKDYNIKAIGKENNKRMLLIRKILSVMLAILVIFVIFEKKNNNDMDNKHEDLIKCVDYLENFNKDKVALYTGYNDGAYLEFRGFKVYLDTRADVFLKTNNKKYNIMEEFTSMQSGKIYYEEVLNKYNFTHLLVPNDDILNVYLPYSENYKIIYSSEYYKIFENIKYLEGPREGENHILY
jgi:hypothetical protein